MIISNRIEYYKLTKFSKEGKFTKYRHEHQRGEDKTTDTIKYKQEQYKNQGKEQTRDN